ncbi:MAG: exonuclease SbcCD subunit D [Methylacidiphilales bacterium]|nr:exonuclease SbcCD subunit D [Candidatus Methylacidiphilales bacterium]
MRFLHTADLHLGRQFGGLPLETDHQAVLDQIVAALQQHRVDALIIAGDVFDRAAPPASAVRQFGRFLARVANDTAAAVVLIAGNHDSGDRIGMMAALLDPRRALIRGPLVADEVPLVLRDSHGEVAISALPFAYEYAACECFGDHTIATPEDVLRAQVTAARRRIPPGARWVIVAHAFVAGGEGSNAERPLARVGGIETVSLDTFAGAHYVALGHLHRPQATGSDHIRYAGAPLALGFDEVGQVKSMTLVDLDAVGAADVCLIPFAPARGVRVLRGTLAELLHAAPAADFVRAVLTDPAPLIDPMKRLREVFPNACELAYARDQRAPEIKSVPLIPARLGDPVEMIDDFLDQMRGERLSAEERAQVKAALEVLCRTETLA